MIDELVAHSIPSYDRMGTESRIKAHWYPTMELVAFPISMKMAIRRSNSSFAVIAFCFYLVIFTTAETNSSCPGPTAYYKALGCTPVSTNTSSSCPERYDCDVVKILPTDKCFMNGHLYDIGEHLRDEDANPCDIGCVCEIGYLGVASFNCAEVDCFFGPENPGCYRKGSPLSCCTGEEVCPDKPEDRPTCVVDGKTYKDGEYFQAPGEPDKSCVCQPGYKGENIEPFCAAPKHPYCSPMLRNAYEVHRNCAPVYYSNQPPATSCSVSSRCQNRDDVVIASTDNSSKPTDPNMMCKFGNMTMQVGDELNQGTDYSSVCVKCVCEVPPVPTCQRLPDSECDVTKHAKFDRS